MALGISSAAFVSMGGADTIPRRGVGRSHSKSSVQSYFDRLHRYNLIPVDLSATDAWPLCWGCVTCGPNAHAYPKRDHLALFSCRTVASSQTGSTVEIQAVRERRTTRLHLSGQWSMISPTNFLAQHGGAGRQSARQFVKRETRKMASSACFVCCCHQSIGLPRWILYSFNNQHGVSASEFGYPAEARRLQHRYYRYTQSNPMPLHADRSDGDGAWTSTLHWGNGTIRSWLQNLQADLMRWQCNICSGQPPTEPIKIGGTSSIQTTATVLF